MWNKIRWFESSSIIYITPTDSASMQDLMMLRKDIYCNGSTITKYEKMDTKKLLNCICSNLLTDFTEFWTRV